MKICNRCKEPKALTEFGRNKYYVQFGAKDGLSIYCKVCNWRTTIKARAEFQKSGQKVERKPMVKAKPTIADRVWNAILAGHQTREQIHEATGLTYDQVGDGLAEIWDRGSVRIQRVGELKFFVPAKAA